METKIEMYMCSECETAISKPCGNDDTGYLCEKCWDDVLARGDAMYEAMREERYAV